MEPVRKNSQILDKLFTYRNVQDLEEYLENNPQIDIVQLKDSQGNTVLHQLAFEGHLELLKVYIRKAKLRCKRRESTRSSTVSEHGAFEQWINHRNNQGYTSLLYASFNGHLGIIKYLIQEHRADYRIRTNTGLNPLHLSAQKNIIMPFLYFRNLIDLYQLDDLKSTALHWAAYTNSEQVVAYILAQTDDLHLVNLRDTQGNTPLSLAVSYGNTRIVRRLLIKGANRYIRNMEGKRPIDIAKESEFKTISRMLDEQFSVFDMFKFYCNIKIEYRPKGRKAIIPLLFLISYMVNLFIINFFLSFTNDYSLYTEIAFMGIMLCYYLSLLLQKPKSDPKDIETFLEDYHERTIKKVCFICRNRSPKRGYHCDICGVCIQQYDHHCTWINNCVGKRNIARFIIFIVMLVISLAFIGIVAVLASIVLLTNDPLKFQQYFTLRYMYESELQRFCMLGCFLVNELTAVFFLPVFLLCVVQIKNLLTNKTTFQKIRGPVEEPNRIKSKISRQSKMSLQNCRVMCADTRASFATTTKSSFSELITETKYLSSQRPENFSHQS